MGFNALIEASNKTYLEPMRQWIDIALEEGIRFFITSLGDPAGSVIVCTPRAAWSTTT